MEQKTGRSPSEAVSGTLDETDLSAVKVLIQNGDMSAATERVDVLLKTHPNNAQLHNMRGIIAMSTGDQDQAQIQFQTALRLMPDFTSAAANLGIVLMKQKKNDEAISVLSKAVATDPGALQARVNLANAFLNTEQYKQAFDHSSELLDAAPDHLEFLKIRATAAMGIGDWSSVFDAVDKVELVDGVSSWSVNTRFEGLAQSGQTDAALAHGERIAEQHPAVRTRLAELLVEVGRFDDARTWLRKALQHDPDDATAYFHYGQTKRWSVDDPVLLDLKAATDRFARTSDPKGASAFFALAKANMDLERHSAVFPALHKANALQATGWRFDLVAQRDQAHHVRTTWTTAATRSLAGAGIDDVSPIFIVGMPRSGSTLTEHVIEAHPLVTSVGEGSKVARFFPTRMPATPETITEAARAAAKELRKLAGPEGRLLDKYLYNYQRLGSLAAAFPNARFIVTRRDPRAIALSIYSNPLSIDQHPYSANLTDLAQFYVEFHKLMEHWQAVLGNRIVISDYQALVEDPEPNIRSLIDRLGLPWDDACLKPEAVQKRVRTLSVVQVRSGIHTASVERWRHYETDLAPFTDIVSKVWDFGGN